MRSQYTTAHIVTDCHVSPVQNTAMQAKCTSTNGMADGYMKSACSPSVAAFGLLTGVRCLLARCSASPGTGRREYRTRHARPAGRRFHHLRRSFSALPNPSAPFQTSNTLSSRLFNGDRTIAREAWGPRRARSAGPNARNSLMASGTKRVSARLAASAVRGLPPHIMPIEKFLASLSIASVVAFFNVELCATSAARIASFA